jgi:MraZ protein
MFLGHYDHTIDNKGRLTIPSRYRELLADGAFITLGFDGNLIVLTRIHFERLSERFKKMNLTDPATRSLSRLFFSNAELLDTDKVGRILIPQYLRQSAGLETTAIVAGVGDYFEIWSPELWTKQASILQDPEITAQRFAALDLTE